MNKDQCKQCSVSEGTHKPAEAVHQIHEPTVNQQLTIEREAFEEWATKESPGIRLDRKGDGYRYILVQDWWMVWQARAALADTPAAVKQSLTTDAALPEPDAAIKEVMGLVDALQFENIGIVKAVTPYELNTAHRNAQKARAAIESKLRGMLATGGQAQANPENDFPHEEFDAIAATRYKVVAADQSMFWEWAVVAGDGTQQLYVGRKVDCENIARKFAGAFADGAFSFHALHAAPQAKADARDAEQERWMGIGKAIERACIDQPDSTEIVISLERDAGTVTMFDPDGNEHDQFSHEDGFAGVVNAAIEAAIAAAKGE